MQPAFTAKWKEWKDCDELKPKPKERLIFREPEKRGNEASNGKEEYRRLWNEFEMEGFVAQQGLWNLAGENVLQDRGALPQEESDVISEFQATHEENFLRSWLREDGKNKEERIMEVD